MSDAVWTDALGCERGRIDLGLVRVTLHNRVDAEARQGLAAAVEEDLFLLWALGSQRAQRPDGIGP